MPRSYSHTASESERALPYGRTRLCVATPFAPVEVVCVGAELTSRLRRLLQNYPPATPGAPEAWHFEVPVAASAGESAADLVAAFEGALYRRAIDAGRAAGWTPIHAAAIARDGRAVVLVGPSGAGKSTVTLHTLLRDPQLGYGTDDLAFLSTDGSGVRVAGLPRLIGLDADDAVGELPAGFAPLRTPAGDGEPAGRLEVAVPPDRVHAGAARVQAIVFPRYEREAAATRCERLPGGAAATRLFEAIYAAAGDDAAALLARAGAMVARVPSYRLISGTPSAAVDALRTIFETHAG